MLPTVLMFIIIISIGLMVLIYNRFIKNKFNVPVQVHPL